MLEIFRKNLKFLEKNKKIKKVKKEGKSLDYF
jgi:hypothetical protein